MKRIECILSERQLRERMTYWQKRLRLQDWDIELYVKRKESFSEPGRIGELHAIDRPHNWILIYLLDPKDYNLPEEYSGFDMEKTLVHELLHIRVIGFAPNKYSEQEEIAINALCDTLVELDRERLDKGKK